VRASEIVALICECIVALGIVGALVANYIRQGSRIEALEALVRAMIARQEAEAAEEKRAWAMQTGINRDIAVLAETVKGHRQETELRFKNLETSD
jgi:hypothetical protein